jgi:hypothetical protein
VQAPYAYHAGTMKTKSLQYTIRNVPDRTDRRLREAAIEHGASLNSVTLQALSQGLGLSDKSVVHHDLDDLIGSWVLDNEFDKALEEMDRIDPELWK